ncbi:MAG: selenocysteine-specific translation elongation factor [Planctomycetota bacterium]|nr:selenocysteine-specific translation elongation factor [Planctomycetota bacterium]
MTRQLILGTAGHIDHGKTQLIRALTGIDTDRLPQEKERGITIDIGFAFLDVGDYRLGIVDVPGHERFIRNMLAGAAGIDLALLVVAADDSVMPQTREHLAILQLLQVRHGLVAITKADLAEPDWLDLVEEDIRTLVSGTFLESAPIVRTSAVSRAGLDELTTVLAGTCTRIEAEEVGGLFRLAVDRSFTLRGLGTIVTGTVWSGRASVGEEVQWLPPEKKLRIRGLQTHGKDAETTTKGQRAAINLQGVHHTEIHRGHELATPGLLRPARRITVLLNVLADSPCSVQHRSRLRLHLGTQEVIAGVRLLRGTTIEPGGEGYAQLICAEPIVGMARQPFVIRRESPLETIGGGIVIQPASRQLSRRDPKTIERLEELRDADEAVRAQAAIFFMGGQAWDELDLCREADLAPARARAIAEKLIADGTVRELPVGSRRALRLHRDFLGDLRKRITKVMKRLHDAAPLETAIPRQRLAGRLGYLGADVVQAVVDRMLGESALVGDESAFALASFKPRLTAAQKRLAGQVLEAFEAAGFQPPEVAKLAKSAGIKEDEARAVVELCADQGELVHLSGGLYIHRGAEERLRRRITEILRGSDGMTVSEIKDALEITRRHAVPICEYLDRIGLTKRRGDYRVLAKESDER